MEETFPSKIEQGSQGSGKPREVGQLTLRSWKVWKARESQGILENG